MLNIKSADGAGLAFPALRGMSAYQVAVANGFEGTEAEWLNSLRPKPTFFVTKDGNILYHYDNPDTPVTEEEMADAYFGGGAYVIDVFSLEESALPARVISFSISSGSDFLPQANAAAAGGYPTHYEFGSSADRMLNAMAKYIP